MALRRLTPREYLVDLVAVTVGWPVYRRREWLDRAALDRFALLRSRQIAVHANQHVLAYRELYGRAGVDPAAIHSWADFEQLPLADKDLIRDGYPDRSVAQGSDLAGCLLSTSSGSSGRMMVIPHRADRLWPYLLSSQRMLRWAAGGRYPFWWRQAYVYTSEYPLLRVPGFYPLTFIPTAAEPGAIVDRLEQIAPHILHTYPTVLRDMLAAQPARMRRLGMKGVSVGSELSSPDERDAWQAALGCPVRDEYSTEELGRIASQCPRGSYHLHEDVVKTEILDADGRPTRDVGEVVGTELHNRTMPFVRYRQGDLARISDEQCPCGRATRLLVDLVGRRNDGFVLADGRSLSAGFLLDVAYRALIAAGDRGVVAYRFVQRDRAHAEFEVVPGPSWSPAMAQGIVASIERELSNSGLSLSVAAVEAIARGQGGKRQTVVRLF